MLEKYKNGTIFVDFKPSWFSIPTLMFVVVLITFSEELGQRQKLYTVCTLVCNDEKHNLDYISVLQKYNFKVDRIHFAKAKFMCMPIKIPRQIKLNLLFRVQKQLLHQF